MKTINLLILFTSILALGADKKAIHPPGAKPAGPYSPGIVAGSTLYVAGQVGRFKDGTYPEKFEEEVAQTLINAEEIMKAAGYTFADAVSVQVYLTDMDLFQRMNEVYMKYFPEPRPARTTVGIAKLVGPARIEITITAWKDSSRDVRLQPVR